MLRAAKLAGFVILALQVNALSADQGVAPLAVTTLAAEAPPAAYSSSPSAPMWLPPPPAPASMPIVVAPAGSVVTYRPVLPVIPMPGQYYVGRGLLGQPKLYVPNQPLRNFVRYLSP